MAAVSALRTHPAITAERSMLDFDDVDEQRNVDHGNDERGADQEVDDDRRREVAPREELEVDQRVIRAALRWATKATSGDRGDRLAASGHPSPVGAGQLLQSGHALDLGDSEQSEVRGDEGDRECACSNPVDAPHGLACRIGECPPGGRDADDGQRDVEVELPSATTGTAPSIAP